MNGIDVEWRQITRVQGVAGQPVWRTQSKKCIWKQILNSTNGIGRAGIYLFSRKCCVCQFKYLTNKLFKKKKKYHPHH